MDKIIIKGGTLHTMTDKGNFIGDVLILDGKIAGVEKEINDSEAKIIDAKGLHVLPGLIDAHSHLGLFNFNSDKGVDDANEMTKENTPAMDARYGVDLDLPEFQASIRHGITTLLLTPGSGNVICGLPFVTKSYGTNIFDMTVKFPCALKIAFGGNPKNTYGARGQLPMTRMGIAHVLREKLTEAKHYMEEKDAGKNPDYDMDLEAIIPALKGEIPFKMHCTQYDMLTAIEIAKEFHVEFSLEHAWGATDYLDEIVESGANICYGPIATYRSPGERRKVDVEAVKLLDDRGVNVAIITDSPILSIESLYHHIGEAVREGLDVERALRMVTINPAKILKVEDRLGSLEIGKDGDLAIFKGLLGLDTNAEVQYTLVEGKVVYQNK
ncbi:MAG: amidohydrolase family protein [Lachnospiraceae bacterium]